MTEDDSNESKPTALTVSKKFEHFDLLQRATANVREAAEEASGIRKVRRGKFFLSEQEQILHASLRRPIFEHYCHGVVVGEEHWDPENAGTWCYGAHNDFELIPSLTPLNEWPEYVRTPVGFARKFPNPVLSRTALNNLLENISILKRLK